MSMCLWARRSDFFCLRALRRQGRKVFGRAGHGEGENGFAVLAFHRDLPAMLFHDALGNGQSQAGTHAGSMRLIRLIEALENVRQIGFGDAFAIVFHLRGEPLPGGGGFERDVARRRI